MLRARGDDTHDRDTPPFGAAFAAPSIGLPKGGGAIRGIGEAFSANPATGTGSLAVPIATSPGRAGFGPVLSLSYDSGDGNGPFGFGWSLAVPAVSRKTDKGLPRYQDAGESDVFVLSGADDLVPALVHIDGEWQAETVAPRQIGTVTYAIRRYRPRVEGAFARIERWTNVADPADVSWRSITRENVTSWYGRTSRSRIADPGDPARIFRWLLSESYDDKGSVIAYDYLAENADEVDTTQAHERNRGAARGTNRYLKRIRYGNRTPYYPIWNASTPPVPLPTDWLFEVVLDYGDHSDEAPRPDEPDRRWPCRPDPFSSYRSGFEIRTYRLCRRVLLFHHFETAPGVGRDCLVRSTDFTYGHEQEPPAAPDAGTYTFLRSVTQSGYVRQGDGYLQKSLPPLELTYSTPTLHDTVRDVDPVSVENVPSGLDLTDYRWADLDGDGASGVLTEQATGWFYKANLSPVSVEREDGVERPIARFAAVEPLAVTPSLANLSDGRQHLLDLGGNGSLDLVDFESDVPGFYERTADRRWRRFTPFQALPNIDWRDANLRFVDLTGDGRADVLITEDDVLRWYPSLAGDGFGEAEQVPVPDDEERGPRLLFADSTQSIYLADMSGDGLTDFVRIRNGEVCYWPNLGYGRFGAKVTMDEAPWFDPSETFDQRRIRLADVDGSGPTDIVYLGAGGAEIYFNQSGNRWSAVRRIGSFPAIDSTATVDVLDLLGNGTACLVWSSPLAGQADRPMRYIDLMGGRKPHLLTSVANNLGAETRITYASSTRFSLADKLAGTPWSTRLPFPVQVVDKVETIDHISRSRFVSRYAYHHGCFDGVEREFRGFGLVEQQDTETYEALAETDASSPAANEDAASHVPPVLTRTWFHTGVPIASATYAALGLQQAVRRPEWSPADEREACRALKGLVLREEVFALDGGPKEALPYSITEQTFDVVRLQPAAGSRHGVFLVRPVEQVASSSEREPDDPRVSHTLTLEVDGFGNVRKSAAIAYGRTAVAGDLDPDDRARQAATFITYTENIVTNGIDAPDAWRTPLPCESRTYELTGYTPSSADGRFVAADLVTTIDTGLAHVFDTEVPPGGGAAASGRTRRLITHTRQHYRPDDLGGPSAEALLPLGQLELLALPGEGYQLALTPDILASTFQRTRDNAPPENLLPDPVSVLGSAGADGGGYRDLDGDGRWWSPTGRAFYSPTPGDSGVAERDWARQHFFQRLRFRNPFGAESIVTYDTDDLLIVEATDAAGNVVGAENDYRVLQPTRVVDANGNVSAAAFDVMGLVAGTATMSASGQEGDSLEGFAPDLTPAAIDAFLADPIGTAPELLGSATTRVIYDVDRYQLTADSAEPQPPFSATLSRETHVSDLADGQTTRIQISLTYSNGFGAEIQRKVRAAPGPAPARDAAGRITIVDGHPVMTADPVDPRWVGSGWTVFNNKGNAVRQFEPFFTDRPTFEADVRVGVGPIFCYDPLERVVATIYPNHTWEKLVIGGWLQWTWDANDTATIADPRTDPDVGGFFARLPESMFLPTWHAARQDGARGALEQAAALKTAAHAGTPTAGHLDAMGRTFLTVQHNRVPVIEGPPNAPPQDQFYRTRTLYDIEGRTRDVVDARGRLVVQYTYDLAGTRLHQHSMDAGRRWILPDVLGSTIRTWDDRGHAGRMEYDALRRARRRFVRGTDASRSDPRTLDRDTLVEDTEYGEGQPDAPARNLRLQVFRRRDGSGTVTNESYDFKGNVRRVVRRIADDYKALADWSADVALGPPRETLTTYDALNRVLTVTTPDASVARQTYNDANLLDGISVSLGGEAAATPIVTGIEYDPKGQRTRIAYGNGVETRYRYEPDTFRLVHVYTRRSGFTEDCAADPPPPGEPCGVQNLHYVYDAVGNCTSIRDLAQQTVFFRNRRVEPSTSYTYDAVYRLVEAAGREHLGQNGGGSLLPPAAPGYHDGPRTGVLHPGDGNAMGTYREYYRFDAAGNLVEMIHRGSDPAHAGWRRTYAYDAPSLIAATDAGDRLTRTTVNPDAVPAASEDYVHDAHGNMAGMPHLDQMAWDFADRLQWTRRQSVAGTAPDDAAGERTFYVYDADGERVRKVTELASGQIKEDRLYIGGFEVYERHGTDPLVRETLHVLDDRGRIAVIDTRTSGSEPGVPARLVRYQHGNHLGSATLELDAEARVISYEEYFPYGSSAYRAVRQHTECPKRYAYTGKERDEETGFYYHGARYYAPWLARWTAPDPSGLVDGPNLYMYVRGNPVMLNDPSGRNTPSSATDRQIMLMTDPQLHAHLKAMSPTARASFAGGATGAFATRAWAMLNKYEMPIGYDFPADTIKGTAPKPPPAAPVQPYRAPLENVKHADPWLPRAIVREAWEDAIDDAADSSLSGGDRAVAGAAAIFGIFPTAAEVIVHGLIAAPQLAVTETIAAGEHGARAYLLSEQGADSAALDEILASGQAGATGVSNAATTVATVGGGVQALTPKAPYVKPPIGFGRTPIKNPYAEVPAGVPQKPPVGLGRPPAPGGNPWKMPPPPPPPPPPPGTYVKPRIGFGSTPVKNPYAPPVKPRGFGQPVSKTPSPFDPPPGTPQKPPIGFGRPPAPGGNPWKAPPPPGPPKKPIGFRKD